MKKILLITLFFNLAGHLAFAQVRISEIMYDLEGIDTKREWIEVENIGQADISLDSWKLFEDGVNHKLTYVEGESILPSGSFVVIAVDAPTFLSDWPSFSGTLFDSSFSLKNTGELLEIRDENLVSIYTVTYTPDWGAKDDGNSLQLVNNSWIADTPTPGEAHSSAKEETNETTGGESSSENENSEEITTQSGSGGSVANIKSQIFAEAGNDRVVIVGADIEFRGEAIGLKGVFMEADRYIWNFGDGFTKEGKAVFHAYQYPGTYIATLNVAAGKYTGSDQVIVDAREAIITISYAGSDRIELLNQEDFELDLSWWILESSNTSFTLPRSTTILPKSKLILVKEATGIEVRHPDDLILLYPNGVPVSSTKKVSGPKRTTFGTVATAAATQNNEQDIFVESTPTNSDEEELVDGLASPLAATGDIPTTDTNLYKWLLALISILSVAAIASLIMRREARTDEIEIID